MRFPPRPAPGRFRSPFRSPLRGPWLTSVLGMVLLAGLPLLFVTGLLSYAASRPGTFQRVNDQTPGKGLLGLYLSPWPTHPYWLYRLTQGAHVTLGITLVPILLAKLWSVVPKLFTLPPVRSVGHTLERLSLLMLVGGGLFEFATGVLNVQLDYLFPGSFYTLHFYERSGLTQRAPCRPRGAADAAGGAGAAQPGLPRRTAHTDPPYPPRTPRRHRPGGHRPGAADDVAARRARARRPRFARPVRPDRRPEHRRPPAEHRPARPPRPRHRRRPGRVPPSTRRRSRRTYAPEETGENWRLTVRGNGRTVHLTLGRLQRLARHTIPLPIACVEGWSTENQHWEGVRLRDLAALVGHDADPPGVFVESVQLAGSFRAVALRANQVRDPRSLLALGVNGAPLTADHGYPTRIIVPNAPGVMNTKWVRQLTFGAHDFEGRT